MNFWIETLGWVGSATLIAGLLQKQMIPLRMVSMVAAVLLVAYNFMITSWPMVAMNLVIFAINAIRLRGALQERQRSRLGLKS